MGVAEDRRRAATTNMRMVRWQMCEADGMGREVKGWEGKHGDVIE